VFVQSPALVTLGTNFSTTERLVLSKDAFARLLQVTTPERSSTAVYSGALPRHETYDLCPGLMRKTLPNMHGMLQKPLASDTTLSAVLTTKENELNTAKGDLVSALDLYLARFVL